MSAKFNTILLLLLIKTISLQGKDNKYNATYYDDLKNKFGCTPPENWNIVERNEESIQVVCKAKDYDPHDKPVDLTKSPMIIDFEKIKIVDVDERKRTITMDTMLTSFWRDERIKAVFSGNIGVMQFPPFTTGQTTNTWSPYEQAIIKNLKERIYILNPIVWQYGLLSSSFPNFVYVQDAFPANASVVWSQINWRVTVLCSFNLSEYPFDANHCLLEMQFPLDLNVSLHGKASHSMHYDANGFSITLHPNDPHTIHYPSLAMHLTTISFGIELKRQPSKYIFQFYLPVITIVIASGFSFIIPVSAIPGRIALVVTQFLTLTNIFIHQEVFCYENIDYSANLMKNLHFP